MTGVFCPACHVVVGQVTDLDLPAWEPPSDTTTTTGAFSRCQEVSAEYTAFLRSRGVAADWIQVGGPRGQFPDADPRWRGVAQADWNHYLTRVTDTSGHGVYVDWTARQFDPRSGHPHVTRADVGAWETVRLLRPGLAEEFLAAWRHTHALAPRH